MLETFVKKPGKYNGKEYKTGDKYPFDADSAADKQALSLGFFELKNAGQKQAPKKTARSKSK